MPNLAIKCNFIRRLLGIIFVPLLLTSSDSVSADEQALVVNVRDIKGMAEPDLEISRENLLQDAFHEAASRKEWLGEYQFRYNQNIPKEQRGYLEFNVTHWDRSVANSYNFGASARYRNFDGEEIHLGNFSAMESGIAVTTGRDVGEHFKKAAQSAFEDALKKLEKAVEE